MGRRRVNFEQMPGRFPERAFERMDAVLAEGENRSDLLRDAVEAEISRRERAFRATTRSQPRPIAPNTTQKGKRR